MNSMCHRVYIGYTPTLYDQGLWLSTKQRDDAQGCENDRSRHSDGFERELAGNPIARNHDRNVGQHHSECRPSDNGIKEVKPRREADGRNLRLVADFGEEERDESSGEGARSAPRALSALVSVRKQCPDATLRNEKPRTQCIHRPVRKFPSSVPARPAAAWLAMVANNMPKMIGTGR